MPAYRNSAQIDMTHGSVLGRAALFALPICAGNILQLLYSTVDTLVIGNFCDTTALASVATSSQPLEILLCVFVGIGSGISILVSQAVGRADHDQLQKLVRTSVWLLFAASLPLTVIGFLLGPWMLRLMQVPADAMPGAVLYLRITMLGILGNMGYNFNAGLLRGIGNSSSSLLLLFISCAANIVLDLVLTGALGLGIGGVAAATAIALFLSWICSIFYIRRRCTELALPVLPCGFDAGALRQIVRIGLPLGLNSALYSIGHIFLQVLYNLQGSVFVAGCSVAGKVGGLANITVTSLSQATSVFAGAKSRRTGLPPPAQGRVDDPGGVGAAFAGGRAAYGSVLPPAAAAFYAGRSRTDLCCAVYPHCAAVPVVLCSLQRDYELCQRYGRDPLCHHRQHHFAVGRAHPVVLPAGVAGLRRLRHGGGAAQLCGGTVGDAVLL